ncbi:Protein Casc3 [Manis pentadactyla]|nr:Protein Casc3 [Manis pentadactyla]
MTSQPTASFCRSSAACLAVSRVSSFVTPLTLHYWQQNSPTPLPNPGFLVPFVSVTFADILPMGCRAVLVTQRTEPCLLTLLTDFGLDHIGAHLGLRRTLFKAAGVTKMYPLAVYCPVNATLS